MIAPGRASGPAGPRRPLGARRRAGRDAPRAEDALRAGLGAAVAFRIALGDDCAGVIGFCAPGIVGPDAQVTALFATVGAQLAQHLERRRLAADESPQVEEMLQAERERARRYLERRRLPRPPRLAHRASRPRAAGGAPAARPGPRAAAGAGVALLHIGLDGFKLVNDSLGHTAGDELLRRLAIRLRESVRATDLLARPAGDEFLVLLADLEDDPVAIAERVAGEIVAVLAEPFLVAGAEFPVSASIGIAMSPDDAAGVDDAPDPRRRGAGARQEARAGRLGPVHAGGADPRERLSLAARLRRALARDEFVLHYQPIFAVDTGAPAGVEALLRWHDAERGAWCRPASSSPWPRRRA